MQCIICKGKKLVISNDQIEICQNCEGSGEIVTEDMVNGNDCPNGQCS